MLNTEKGSIISFKKTFLTMRIKPLTIILMGLILTLPLNAQKRKGETGNEPLFGKDLASYTVASDKLAGATFYLVSGHGGPDPGAMGLYQGRPLYEDEYAYDIILRLARELMMRGAKVHIIIQDKKDGIREDRILPGSERETCMGKAIPLKQNDRLQQRAAKINELYRKDNSRYKRAVFIHVDSRSESKQTDVFFYHAPGSKNGKRLADNLRKTFADKYKQHQPGRGFTGTVSERNLYVLRNTTPVGVFLELGNIRNKQDQKRIIIPSNRQALARWIADGIESDFK